MTDQGKQKADPVEVLAKRVKALEESMALVEIRLENQKSSLAKTKKTANAARARQMMAEPIGVRNSVTDLEG